MNSWRPNLKASRPLHQGIHKVIAQRSSRTLRLVTPVLMLRSCLPTSRRACTCSIAAVDQARSQLASQRWLPQAELWASTSSAAKSRRHERLLQNGASQPSTLRSLICSSCRSHRTRSMPSSPTRCCRTLGIRCEPSEKCIECLNLGGSLVFGMWTKAPTYIPPRIPYWTKLMLSTSSGGSISVATRSALGTPALSCARRAS